MSQSQNQTPKKHDINALNALYKDGDSVDQEVLAEYRSNLLLIAGEHYNRRQSSFYRRIRDSRELSQEQKMRLTKNHIQKIVKTYVNNILSADPGVGFRPKDENSMQNQKEAELCHSVWMDAWERYNLDDLRDDWCDSIMGIGEVAVKIGWDPDAGPVVAYQQKVDEGGNPVYFDTTGEETLQATDPMTGQPFELAPDEEQEVHQGEFVFEEIYAFNLLRGAEVKDLRKAGWLCDRKMVSVDYLKSKYPDKSDMITASGDETFMVFEGARAGYRKTDTEVLIREFFFRVCPLYPKGWFYVTTKTGILEQGELPGGIFPIVVQPLEKIPTTPRGRSPVKIMRPYQAEINRAASKMAEHQITLGDDKLLLQNGTKASAGVSLPGVRTINYTGTKPEILPGRSGAQYLEYMTSQITELYQVMNVSEDSALSKTGQMDPYMLLFTSAKQKRAFQRHTQRFNKFLIEVSKTYLELAKIYLPDDQLIYAVGKNEVVNVQEFKKMEKLSCQIVIEQQSDDIETKLGKQLAINHTLQYVGTQLKPEDIGKLMRAMPYANEEKCFDDMTIDYDSITDDMLAMDRGEMPPVHPYDNHVYCAKKLGLRTRKRDFTLLNPQIQNNYMQRIQLHDQLEVQRQQQLQRMQRGYIPTGGYLASCQLYVPDSKDPNNSKQVRVPSEAIQWLVKQLESQGQSQDQLEQMNPGMQDQIAGMMNQGQHPVTDGQHKPIGASAPMAPNLHHVNPGAGSPFSHPGMGGPQGGGAPHPMQPGAMGRR